MGHEGISRIIFPPETNIPGGNAEGVALSFVINADTKNPGKR
jgi:hypothetical protein